MINKKLLSIFYFIFPIFIIFKLPISSNSQLVFITLLILFFISNLKFHKLKINFLFLVFLLLILINFFTNNKNIMEKSGIYLPNEFNQSLYDNYNEELFNILNLEFNNTYPKSDYNCKDKGNCWANSQIKNIFSQNFHLFNNNDSNIKYKSKINHTNLSTAKIGMINNILMYWYDYKNISLIKRENAPYFLIYTFNKNQYNNEICWKGRAILIDEALQQINHNETNCIKITKGLEILLYNFNSILEVKIKKNNLNKVFDTLKFLIQLTCFFLFIKIFVKSINFNLFYKFSSLIFLSFLQILYIYYFRDEFTYGYMPLQAGMDGFVHEGYGRILSNHLVNFNFYEFFRGNENLFYFMPGLRYLSVFEKIFFGNNFNLIILILIFFPLSFYFLLRTLQLNKNICFFIVISFILFKISYIGFSFNHYARGALTVYPETFAIFCFLISIIFFYNKNYFISGFFCFLMVFLRPNYFPVFFIFFLFNIYQLFKYNNYKIIFCLLGLSFLSIMPFHNLFYGKGEFALFTSSAFISHNLKIDFYDYLIIFNNIESFNRISNHLLNWISAGQKDNFFAYILNSFLIINLIVFTLINFKKFHEQTLLFSLFAFSQQSVLFFYSNTGRYAYFAWFLVLIANFLIFKNYYKFKFIKSL